MTTILTALQGASGGRFILDFASQFYFALSPFFIISGICLCVFRQNSTLTKQVSIRLFIVDLGLRCRCFGPVNNKPFFNLFLNVVHEVMGRYSNFLSMLSGKIERERMLIGR